MAAPKGNDYALKLNTPELRREAYKAYCDHIAEGWPKEAFVFEKGDFSVVYKTIDISMEEYPDDYPPILMQRAMSKRYKHWLTKGNQLMEGKFRNGSPVVWQTMM